MDEKRLSRISKLRIFWSRPNGNQPELFLYKYSPKFTHDLVVDRSGKIKRKWINRVKSLKVIKNLSTTTLLKAKKSKERMLLVLLSLFQPHRRTITHISDLEPSLCRYFPHNSDYALNSDNIGSWKGFFHLLYIRSLKIFFEEDKIGGDEKRFAKIMWRFTSHLKRLKNFADLELTVKESITSTTKVVYQKLNDIPDTLEKLKNLKIKMNISKPVILKSTESLFKNIFHYATKFELQDSLNYSADYISGHFHDFENLQILKLAFLSQGRGGGEGKQTNEPFLLNYLSHIGNLSQLVELKINLFWISKGYIIEFFRSFNIPHSLQKFFLTISEPKWLEILQKPKGAYWQDENPFEREELFNSFYEKWNDKKNLQTLSVRVENSDLLTIPNFAFIIPVLKNLSTLKELIFESIVISEDKTEKKALNLCDLWTEIAHLKSTLEVLIIKEFGISIRNFEFTLNRRASLKRLELGKFVLGDRNLVHLVEVFGEKHHERRNHERSLILDYFAIDNNESFVKFLEAFVHFPVGIHVNITADLRKVDSRTLFKTLSDYIPKIHKNKNLDLSFINIPKNISKDSLKQLNDQLKSHPSFCYFELIKEGGRSVYLFDKKFHNKELKKEEILHQNSLEFNSWVLENDASDGEFDLDNDNADDDGEGDGDENGDEGQDEEGDDSDMEIEGEHGFTFDSDSEEYTGSPGSKKDVVDELSYIKEDYRSSPSGSNS